MKWLIEMLIASAVFISKELHWLEDMPDDIPEGVEVKDLERIRVKLGEVIMLARPIIQAIKYGERDE